MMSSDLLPYYERELLALRKLSGEFATRYPERAAALQISRSGCDDPHVERLLEGFALLTGRIQRKLDDEFPEITQSLIELLYPHLLRPIPSMTILQFEVDPALSRSSSGHLIPRGTTAYSAPVKGVQCRFRTASETRLWPLQVRSAGLLRTSQIREAPREWAGAKHAIRLELGTLEGCTFGELKIPTLRIRLGGDTQAANWLYELLFTHVRQILVRSKDKSGVTHTATLPPDAILPVGFSRQEALLPYAETSFQGYRLLQEYFCFPEKFLFFDFVGLADLPKPMQGEVLELLFVLRPMERTDWELVLETAINTDTFQLGCVPAINLFERNTDPIRVSHTKTEYPLLPDVHAPDGMEVYSVDRVTGTTDGGEEVRPYRPFYCYRHEERNITEEAFWFPTRRAAERKGDGGTDVFLSLVDRAFKPSQRATEVLTAHVTCSNRDLPLALQLKGTWGELDLESGAAVKIRVAHGPTPPVRVPLQSVWQWRLISHLSLNHLSIVDDGGDALRELLRLYRPLSSASTARQIDGITGVHSARKMARVEAEFGYVFCQGVTVDLTLDEDSFAGGSAYLFGSVLDRFLALYCAVNSFTQLRVSVPQRKGVAWQWPLRSGEQPVV
ncbi:MAG TPA: type VI secretion system baseplate subunit TssF [Acidobacteriaceae bacterium]|nr:type VI secretion system baseplate subunit TssF [Acidobacteriaceae bacterium]